MDDKQYFKAYRNKLGFTSQVATKAFLSSKTVVPDIDFPYIELLLDRVRENIRKLNGIMYEPFRIQDIEAFIATHIDQVYELLFEAGLIPSFNNQRRRPEQVFFSWLWGHACTQYLTTPIAAIFGIESCQIEFIGDDDPRSIEDFKRTSKADLAITLGGKQIRIDVQSGFHGVNDIKQSKVNEAGRQWRESSCITIVIHLDFYNGQIAFVRVDPFDRNDANWITREQLEGQTVFNINQNSFAWRIMDPPPSLESLDLGLGG